MKNYVITLAVLCILTLILLFELDNPKTVFLLYFIVPSVVLSSFGLAYYKYQNKRLGYIALVGLTLFIPISIFGILAIRDEMDKEVRRKFMRELNNE